MTYRYEFDETGGYDCMYGAFDIFGPDGARIAEVDLRHHGQKACDWGDQEAKAKAETFAQAFVAGLNASALPEAPRSGWIPVGERLPSPHTDNDFIVATISGYVCALYFGESGWYVEFEDSAKDGYWNGCVTHWQPLPAAPSVPSPLVRKDDDPVSALIKERDDWV